MSVETTMDYAGFALSTAGAPLVDRTVTLMRADTLATLGSVQTDATGKWFFNDIAPTPEVKAEISAGTTPQIAVKRCWSGDVWSLYVREKLTAAPAAIVNLPPLANIYSNSVLLTTALDARYVNVGGDTLTGTLNVSGLVNCASLAVSGDSHLAGLLEVSGDLQANTAYISYLNVGADATIAGTLTVDTIVGTGTGSIAAGSGGLETTGDVYGVGLGIFDGGLQVAGGTLQIDNLGNFHHTSGTASFEGGALSIPNGPLVVSAITGPITVAGQINGSSNIVATGILQGGSLSIFGAALVSGPLTAAGNFLHGGTLGFFGAGGQTKPTVSGPKGGNAALTSLCSALATLGLITNSTTA